MKCDMSRASLIDFFYGELDEGDRSRVELHTQACPACQAVLQELQEATGVLRLGSEEAPRENLTFVANDAGNLGNYARGWWGRLGRARLLLAFATAFAIIVLCLSLARVKASYDADGFVLTFGEPVASEESPQARTRVSGWQLTRSEFEQQRRSDFFEIQEMFRESEARQLRSQQIILEGFARDLDSQRRQDMMWVGRGLQSFSHTSQVEIDRTQLALQELMLVTNAQGNQIRAIQFSKQED